MSINKSLEDVLFALDNVMTMQDEAKAKLDKKHENVLSILHDPLVAEMEDQLEDAVSAYNELSALFHSLSRLEDELTYRAQVLFN